ncbi:glycosyl hydrolase family 61-domain-containing protein [Hypoxylon sp. FL1284]|nr:glycosyl hydrolase family 61-domain-containing protein [Hypoxylon sp. FL1284]
MGVKLAVAAFAALVCQVQGHFSFVRIAHNGEWQEPLRFIRNKTSPFEEPQTPDTNVNTRGYHFPTYSTDLPESARCGRDNVAHAANTEVLTVKAGDTVEFAHQRKEPYMWADDQWYDCPEGRGSCDPDAPDMVMDINHPGPFLAHLSKVPEGQDVREYDGSGEWTKIWTLGLEMEEGAEEPVHWLAWNNQKLPGRFIFKIPAQTPAGQYLLRTDIIWPGFDWPEIPSSSLAQLYPTCTQIQVESEFDGDLPSGGILIPEDLSPTSPGMSTTLDMYRNEVLDEDFVYPGGMIWDGEKLVVDKPTV